jgi:serine phosphatase RsbU (regulator of sigma subunit)
MAESSTALHRLLAKNAVEDLFASFAPLLTNNPVAMVALHGAFSFQHGPVNLEELADAERAWKAGKNRSRDGLVILPLRAEDQIVGLLIGKEETAGFLAIHTSLELLINSGLDKRRLARETLDRYREVNLLYHVAEIISGTLDVAEILTIILAEAVRAIQSRCAVAIIEPAIENNGRQVVVLGEEPVVEEVLPILHGLNNEKETTPEPKIYNVPSRWFGCILYAPMIAQEKHLGLIGLVRKPGESPFQSGEEKLLLALASQAGFAIDHALLHYSELQRLKVEQELRIGERIQRSLLPKIMPAMAGWEFAASYQSANQVGGDFFDIYEPPFAPEGEHSLAILIADVTGKGIPAALMMAFAHAIFQATTSLYHQSGEVLAQVNQLIIQHSRSGLLLTAFYAFLFPQSGQVRFANAGHEPPFWYRAANQTCVELDCGSGLLIGARRNTHFPENCVTLDPGDTLVLYTDGITEARSPDGEFFSSERLQSIIAVSGHGTAADLLNEISNEIKRFTQAEPQADDITLLIIKRAAAVT